jgi:hypothetical protein
MSPTPDKRYKKTFLDRNGDDGIVLLRALPWAIYGGGTMGGILGVAVGGIVGGAIGFVAGTCVVYFVTSAVTRAGAGLALRTLQPDGSTTPYQHDFSQIESFVVRGELESAATLWEETLAEYPQDVEARVRAADFFAGAIARHERAMTLYRDVQRMPHAPAERHLYVAQRVVDLYLGPLPDKGKAIVELRKIVDRWPSSTAARFGRDAIARLKAELHGA